MRAGARSKACGACLRRRLSEAEFSSWLERFAYQVGRVLRTTDLIATESESRYAVLLPETDALGAAVLKRRIAEVFERPVTTMTSTPWRSASRMASRVLGWTDSSGVRSVPSRSSSRAS